jgi:hypothetical protein
MEKFENMTREDIARLVILLLTEERVRAKLALIREQLPAKPVER